MARILFVMTALLAVTGGAHGASAYKCKLADGSIAFQQTPCAATAESLGSQAYQKQPDAPHQQYVPSRDGPEARARAEAEAAAALGAPAGAGGASAVRPKTEGYSCSDGKRAWLQQGPCPATVKQFSTAPISGTIVGTGRTVSGTATVAQEVPVEQQELSRDEVCAKVQAGTPTQRKGQGSADAAYERNKLRSKHGC